MKNITLSLSKELADLMEDLPEVNWSQVTRTCIQTYITQRRSPNITPLLKKLRKEKGEDYVNGRRRAEAIAQTLGYSQLNLLLKAYWKKTHQYEQDRTHGPSREPSEHVPTPNDIMEELLISKYLLQDASHAYIQGLRERLLEIANSL